MMRRRADIWSIVERFDMKPACCGRLQLRIAGSKRPSRSRLTEWWWSKLLTCSIHQEIQQLSLLMIWPSLSFTRDVFLECPALALRRSLKTWEKLLVWAAISRCFAWSLQNFRRSLRMAASRSRFSLRYSAKFPERRANRRVSIIFRVSLDIQVSWVGA